MQYTNASCFPSNIQCNAKISIYMIINKYLIIVHYVKFKQRMAIHFFAYIYSNNVAYRAFFGYRYLKYKITRNFQTKHFK